MDNKDIKHVFISYIREDAVVIDKICETFKANDIKYWLDRDHIYPGKFWEKKLVYQGLKSLIESSNGVGFHNADFGHPDVINIFSKALER